MHNIQQSKVDYLSTIEILQDLTPDELMRMDRAVTMATCTPGRIFYMPEETGEVLFLLKKGRVQLYRLSPQGKKLVVATLGPGAIFGEMSLVGQGMHNTYAEAADECTLCVMSRSDVERLMRDKPQVAFRFVQALGDRLTQTERRLEEIAFKSIPARLAGMLLRLSAEQNSDTVHGYTHQELGEIVGTYRETITQTLNDFKMECLVDIGRKKVVLLDRKRLEEMAEN